MRKMTQWPGGEESFLLSSSPPNPLPPFSFLGSRFISRAVKTKNPVPRSFFSPKPNGNACHADYVHGCVRFIIILFVYLLTYLLFIYSRISLIFIIFVTSASTAINK